MPSSVYAYQTKAIRPDVPPPANSHSTYCRAYGFFSLKCEILSVEVRQAKIGNVKWKDVFEQVTNARDPELGISDPYVLHEEQRQGLQDVLVLTKDTVISNDTPTTSAIPSLKELPPPEEQPLEASSGEHEADSSKPLSRYGRKKKVNLRRPPVLPL
ncbi:hypothetical protein VNI00_018186 [Paramarasmius palmivorus]|uniref:Uncharacterized protein n=1 Tax=Paramarasmius palmivorus TaxID=297713 RepID=A0AAW0B319_9AGAR